MGSPYSLCEVALSGDWIPSLGKRPWQPVHARSTDGNILVLVEWQIVNNNPGFRLVVVNEKRQTVQAHSRISGCCESLTWTADGVMWKAFPMSSGVVPVE